jgi:hypothetical protein
VDTLDTIATSDVSRLKMTTGGSSSRVRNIAAENIGAAIFG